MLDAKEMIIGQLRQVDGVFDRIFRSFFFNFALSIINMYCALVFAYRKMKKCVLMSL